MHKLNGLVVEWPYKLHTVRKRLFTTVKTDQPLTQSGSVHSDYAEEKSPSVTRVFSSVVMTLDVLQMKIWMVMPDIIDRKDDKQTQKKRAHILYFGFVSDLLSGKCPGIGDG